MDIESYEPRGDQVIEAQAHSAIVQFDGSPPEIGTALHVSRNGESVYGRIASHEGNRRAQAIFAGSNADIEAGSSVEATDEPAAFRPPDEIGYLDFGLDALVPSSDASIPFEWTRPDFADLASARPALSLGDDALDLFSPVAEGGLNLVIDGAPAGDHVPQLEERVAETLDADLAIAVVSGSDDARPDWADVVVGAPEDAWGSAMALRAGICLAARERDRGRSIFVAGRLPALSATRRASASQKAEGVSMETLVNRIADGLLSVKDAMVTGLLQLPVPSGLEGTETIIESLGIGEPDAQILIGTDGCYDPGRSTSDADRDADARSREREARGILRQADELDDKRAIWGDQELDPAERDMVRRAEAYRRPLFCDTVPST
jgi:hypothetical protein